MIAYKGETVTCENGHDICDVAQDISNCSSVRPEQFMAWRGYNWSQYLAVQHCCVCGAEFMRRTSSPPLPASDEDWNRAMPWISEDDRAYQARRVQLHIGTAWRT